MCIDKWSDTISYYYNTNEFDNAHLWTELDIGAGGYGWMEAVCKGSQSVSILRVSWGQNEATIGTGHEMGHNLGAPHDSDTSCNVGNQGFMSANPDKFSSCSIWYITNYFHSNRNGQS